MDVVESRDMENLSEGGRFDRFGTELEHIKGVGLEITGEQKRNPKSCEDFLQACHPSQSDSKSLGHLK